jgi:hypothetical protein
MATITGGVPSTATASFLTRASAGYLAGTSIPITPARILAYFGSGTLADQIDGLSPLLLTFTASTPQTLDLSALLDAFLAPITTARVRFMLIKNLATTDGFNLLVGGAGTNEWNGPLSSGGKLTVGPSTANNDGFALLSAPNTTGYPVYGTPAGSVVLSWPLVTGATGYKVYRSAASGGEGTSPALLATIGSGSTLGYTDNGAAVAAGAVPTTNTTGIAAPTPTISILGVGGGSFAATGMYYYKMTALNASGESLPSSEASASVSSTANTVPINWSVITGATSYKIYRATSAGGEVTSPALLTTISSGATTTYTDTGTATTAGAVPSTSTSTIPAPTTTGAASQSGGTLTAANYFYKVTSTNASGESTGSAEVAATIFGTSKLLKLDPGANAFQVVVIIGTSST